jgi:hypothetical protein
VDFGDIDTYSMAIEALNILLHDHGAPFMQFGDIKYLILFISSTTTTIMKLFKYAATNIVNKMTIVENLNGFGTKSSKILFTLYMSEFRHMPLRNVINLRYHATYHLIK